MKINLLGAICSMSMLTVLPAFSQAGVQEWNGDQLQGAAPKKAATKKAHKRTSTVAAKNKQQQPAPTLSALSYAMAPPGATLTISGQNFSTKPDGNKVFFNNVQAEVTSASADSISVVVPQWPFGPSQLGISVTVVSDGVKSSNSKKMDIGAKYYTPSQL